MSALVPTRGLANSLSELFEPVDVAPIESLLTEHAERAAAIDRVVATFADPDVLAALNYFVSGNDVRDSYTVDRMFVEPEHIRRAHKALDASFWRRALEATDVLNAMPAKRREAWSEQIRKFDVPPFNEDAIRSTLAEHLAARHHYFAERVDGLFRALSPNHKTNLAAGFRSKMIIEHITSEWYSATSRVDHLVDLRIVVARFMGRSVGDDYAVRALTQRLVEGGRRDQRGEWISVDGGAIEVRLYDNGNCHVRVHDEIAWRLNAVLASVNPGAIPESNRTRPAYTGKRAAKAKTVELVTRPLSFAVLRELSGFDQRERGLGPNEWMYGYRWSEVDKHVRADVLHVLAGLGAVEVADKGGRNWGRVRFDYDATEVLREILASGVIPDPKSHQFYPTPPSLAARVVELADLGHHDTVLEPSAGQGAIAELLPRERTVCIEVSALHCAVLRAKGLTVVQGDFLAQPLPVGGPTRVVMNPPFDRGQWVAHLEHAAKFLAPDGLLVAVLPVSAPKRAGLLTGWGLTWSEPIEFLGTSISVVILVARRS